MAEAKSPSTKDLLLLITGLQVPTTPPKKTDSGDVYWLKEATTNEDRELRESLFNPLWILSPMKAWEGVRFRDWLFATLFKGMAGDKHDFVAIAEPLQASIDVLDKEFTKGMKGVNKAINDILTTKEGRPRSLFNTLSLGISRHVKNGKEVFMFGAGIRRRARFWRTDSTAIQADVEFFVPFYEIPNSEPSGPEPSSVYSINAGICISHSDGSAILDKKIDDEELIAIRFNIRAPFRTRWSQRFKSSEYHLDTIFDDPEVQIQKRSRPNAQTLTSGWHNFAGWEKFSKEFCTSLEGKELLNVPIGPLLLETISDPAGIKDIILKQKKRTEIKTEFAESMKDFKDTMSLLESISQWKPPDVPTSSPNSGQRKLGHLLASLGFMTAKGGADAEYTFGLEEGLTKWDVVNRIFAELDGHPLYVKGTDPKKNNEARIAVSLASQRSETEENKNYFGLAALIYNIGAKTVAPDDPQKDDKSEGPKLVISKENFSKDDSIFLDEDEEEEEEGGGGEEPEEPEKKDEKKSTLEVFAHLGKWLSGETLDDNWYSRLLPQPEKPENRRVPIPGIRILPLKRTQLPKPITGNQQATFAWTLRADLLSVGVDIKSATKDGLVFLQGLAGHFGLGAIEIRLAIKASAEDMAPYSADDRPKEWFDRFSIGVGVKLKDLRLSFGPKEEEKKEEESGNEIIDGLQKLLSDDWTVVPAPKKPADTKVRTRLSAKKKDKFSISFGYLSPLIIDSKGTLDVQLYDEKGNRGKMALIPIDRQGGPIYLRQIGIGLKGVENIELAKGLPNSAQLTVSITGGIRLPVFEMGFIGAKLMFPLNNPSAFQFALDGLDISVKIGTLAISGSFFKSGIEYAGMLTVDHPKASFSAMGFYGSLKAFHMSRDAEILTELNRGNVHKKLKDKLIANKITPADSFPVKRGHAAGEWELKASDNTRYTITDEDDKLNVLRPDKTFFIYAMLTAASGGGPTFGPIQFTGIALGYGYNRKMIVPRIEKVAEFPMVQMIMGEGGYQKDDKSLDPRTQLGKPLEDPVGMLEKMKDFVVAQQGQQFACGGVRFTIGGVVDCFALLVVQWNEKDFELSLLGLARFRHTKDLSAAPICYVEMQILMSLKPSEGTFQLQALLTNNSWIIHKDCKLTGGFALFIWFGGPHKGDWVITFGGYHPRFVRPAHYPIVPRLGLNWSVNDHLSIKGGMYLAITPSCGMLGARLEATFHSGRVSAWFTAYLDVIINWKPLFFEAELGISLRVEASLWLFTLKVTIGASIQLWGPPFGGIARIDLTVISFDIDFGNKRPEPPELVKTWQEFCHNFLNMSGSDTKVVNDPVRAFPMVQPNLAGGRNNVSSIPNSRRDEPQPNRDDDIWKVRADELEFAAASAVPVSAVSIGRVKTNSASEGVQSSSFSGLPLMVNKALALQNSRQITPKKPQKLGAYPMGKSVDSVLNVTIVPEDGAEPPELSTWTMEEEISSMPAALWDPAKPNLRPTEPSAKLLGGCITGIKKLKPPRGKLGKEAVPPPIEWLVLDPGTVPRSETLQEIPSATSSRDIRSTVAGKQDNQKNVVDALKTAGFALTWEKQDPAKVSFRELNAAPLAGSVAA